VIGKAQDFAKIVLFRPSAPRLLEGAKIVAVLGDAN
jgi:hypothetical protein